MPLGAETFQIDLTAEEIELAERRETLATQLMDRLGDLIIVPANGIRAAHSAFALYADPSLPQDIPKTVSQHDGVYVRAHVEESPTTTKTTALIADRVELKEGVVTPLDRGTIHLTMSTGGVLHPLDATSRLRTLNDRQAVELFSAAGDTLDLIDAANAKQADNPKDDFCQVVG